MSNYAPDFGSGLAGRGSLKSAGCGRGLFSLPELASGFAVANSFALAIADAAIELVDDAGHVGPGLMVGRNAVIFVNGSGAGVVSGESQRDVVVIAPEKLIEVSGAPSDILIGREAVGDAKVGGGAGHKLHEAACAGVAYSVGIAVALGFNDAGQEVGIDVVVLSGVGKHEVEIGGGELCFRA